MSEHSERPMNAKGGVLLPAAAPAVITLYRPLLDPLHLTHPQFLVLLTLENGDAHTVGDVGRALALTPPTMTPILKRLDALGYVSRPRDCQRWGPRCSIKAADLSRSAARTGGVASPAARRSHAALASCTSLNIARPTESTTRYAP
jgi:hypothetical protein